MPTAENFFQSLPPFTSFSEFTELGRYQPVPEDWLVVVTDIRNSTEAIEKGLYRAVNATSTTSVVAILNIFKQLPLPYVFGGDGVSMCIPPTHLEDVRSALAASRQLALKTFGLDLRVGIVPLKHIREQGYEILLGKYQPTPHFQQAMFQGGGLAYAESLIKQVEGENLFLLPSTIEPKADFTGFECRWNEVPSSKEEVVTLMVQVLDRLDSNRNLSGLYGEIFQTIESIYGSESEFHPVRPENLSLTFSPMMLSVETRIRLPNQGVWPKIKYLVRAWLLNLAGLYLMKNKRITSATNWGAYKNNLVLNTDYRKFDGILRLVISGTRDQRGKLENYLQEKYADKSIVYGIHVSAGSIFTCIVSDYNNRHVHFLDGANGGYAMAARKMKLQLQSIEKLRS